jgi:hypothetical protein
MSYQTLLQKMGWVDVDDFWGTVMTLITWIPYLVMILPAFLRRNSGIPWYQSYWFKLNVLFRLDETVDQKWTIRRTIVEASFVSMVTLFVIDTWVRVHGPIG